MFEIGQEVIVNDNLCGYHGRKATVKNVAVFPSVNRIVYTVEIPHGDNAVVSFAIGQENLS